MESICKPQIVSSLLRESGKENLIFPILFREKKDNGLGKWSRWRFWTS